MSMRILIAAVAAVAAAASGALAHTPRVVADIAPVHSLVAQVMEGAGEPVLLLDGATSPHGVSLRPSQATALQQAEAVFWMGEALSPGLADAIGALAERAEVTDLMRLDGLVTYAPRQTALFEMAGADAVEEDEDGGTDPHMWLDPANVRSWLPQIAEILAAADPDNAALYRRNADAAVGRLAALEAEIAGILSASERPDTIVFHDAYQHFERAFGLQLVGAISISDAAPPSAARIAALRDRVAELGGVCVLAEPQFDPRVAAAVTEGTRARTATVDPLGATLEPGPGLYPRLMRDMARVFGSCETPP